MSINVSDAYLVAINAESELAAFSAEFGFVPPGAREGLALSSSGFGRLWGSQLDQLNNRVYGMGAKWGSLEMNRCVLGGGWEYINPSDTRQTGEWSVLQCGDDGAFSDPPYIEMTLDKAYDLIGSQIIFDDLGEEWATELKKAYYNDSHMLIGEKTFRNDQANMSIDYQQNGVRYVRYTINRWNFPRRFAKICQVIPGQIRYFTDENVYSFRLKEKISPFESLTIPEYVITFPNENQTYNIINPEGLISKLRERMEIPSSIGIVTAAGIEHVSTGNFPLYAWPDSANDETAAFICRPDLALATGFYAYGGERVKTVSQASAEISAQANLKVPIIVDSVMQGVPVNTRIDLNGTTALQGALSQLAIAAGGIVKFERNGTYKIAPLDYREPSRTITYDNMWRKPDIKQEQPVSGVTVKYVEYVPASGNRSEALNSAMEIVTSGIESGRNISISSNFIVSADEARRVGALALEFYSHRLRYTVIYRGDMSIEAGDVVNVETDYGFRNVLILENEIEYDGQRFLQGQFRGIET